MNKKIVRYINADAAKQIAVDAWGDDDCSAKDSPSKAVESIANCIKRSIQYDFLTARQIEGGIIKSYTPDLERAIKTSRGICQDYAWLFTVMLEALHIQCHTIYGMADGVRHAWNTVYLGGKWVRRDLTYEQRGIKVKRYTGCRVF
jgi:transglutaminase/protease-like cytokinesis protein 3